MNDFKDWDLLAFDIADMLSDHEYPFDLTESDIRPNIEEFISACLATAKDHS